jgi:hypothetical protein
MKNGEKAGGKRERHNRLGSPPAAAPCPAARAVPYRKHYNLYKKAGF